MEDNEITIEDNEINEEDVETSMEAAEEIVEDLGMEEEPPAEEIAVPEQEEPATIPTDEVVIADESRPKRVFRTILRWVLGLAIVFGIGFITALYTLYQPVTRELKQTNYDLEQAGGNISTLESQISDLESRIEELSLLDTKNQELETELDLDKLHFAILSARIDVANALLSLEGEQVAQARIILDGTTEYLTAIESLLKPDEQEVVAPMKQRLELVLSEIEDDPYAAQSDLDVLATNLLQLEDSLFSRP